jgi:hypothetical protein
MLRSAMAPSCSGILTASLLSTPFVDAMLPDGSRLHVVIPQITREHMAVNVRVFIGVIPAEASR